MKIRKSLLCAGAAALLAAAPAQAQSEDAYLGSVYATAASFCPDGTLETQGQLLPINNYQALFSLLTTVFGGDGTTNFGLPDLRGRAPIGYGQGPGLTYIPVGAKSGFETVQMNIAQMPAHVHPASTYSQASGSVALQASTASPSTGNPAGKTFATFPAATPIYSAPSTTPTLMATQPVAVDVATTVTVGSTGGGQSMPIRNPFLGLRYCIVTNGLYPPRP